MVTGAAGFIGSHLCERLIEKGHKVIGLDIFTDFYPRGMKEENLRILRKMASFEFVEGDLLEIDLKELLKGVDVVFHQAAQAGVRSSWGDQFRTYTDNNILATQRLLECCREASLIRFINASSSSIYGDTDDLPMRETGALRPVSPYGVSKLSAENLCYLYWKNMGVPTVSLRYFTVYGPRQRPDMAFHRFIRALLQGKEISVFGDGLQSRDFTYVSDIVEANLLCMDKAPEGESFNIGGGSRTTLLEVFDILGEIAGKKPSLRFETVEKVDVRHTWADMSKARDVLGYRPTVSPKEGLSKQFEWLKALINDHTKLNDHG